MKISVVIPTFNRADKLKNCLEALAVQGLPIHDYEVIIIDDGSSDATQSVLSDCTKKLSITLSHSKQGNKGQGAARNKGIALARGEIILFLGDDIIATTTLLQEHLQIHEKYPQENAAVLGFVTWHPKLTVTPLMRFMERGAAILGRFGGHQFAYDLLEGGDSADYRFFYTSNISLKRLVLLRNPFEECFGKYGWEDIELGYRLTKKENLNMRYNRRAVAYHDHGISEEQWANRMRAIASSKEIFERLHPELKKKCDPLKHAVFKVFSHEVCLSFLELLGKNWYFYGLSKKYFLEGMGK